MMDLEELGRLRPELRKLNERLAELNRTLGAVRVRLDRLEDSLGGLGPVAEQLYVLNQILLQVRKTEGAAGVIGAMLEGLGRLARKSG